MPELLGNIAIALFAVLCSLMLLFGIILVIICGVKLIKDTIHFSFKEPQKPTENRPLRRSVTPMTRPQTPPPKKGENNENRP